MARQEDDLVFGALADPTRRRILDLLSQRESTTGELCERLAPLDRCTTMLHLSVLERAGLVISRREGRFRWNSLDSAPLQRVYDRWVSRYARPSLRLLTQLKTDLERPTRPGTPRRRSRGWAGPLPEGQTA